MVEETGWGWGHVLMLCRIVSSIPRLCLLDASSILSPVVTTRSVSRHCHCLPGRHNYSWSRPSSRGCGLCSRHQKSWCTNTVSIFQFLGWRKENSEREVISFWVMWKLQISVKFLFLLVELCHMATVSSTGRLRNSVAC